METTVVEFDLSSFTNLVFSNRDVRARVKQAMKQPHLESILNYRFEGPYDDEETGNSWYERHVQKAMKTVVEVVREVDEELLNGWFDVENVVRSFFSRRSVHLLGNMNEDSPMSEILRPDVCTARLLDHQRNLMWKMQRLESKGVVWGPNMYLRGMDQGFLSDKVGSGKTVVAAALIASTSTQLPTTTRTSSEILNGYRIHSQPGVGSVGIRDRQQQKCRVHLVDTTLVVVPNSIVHQWKNTFDLFFPKLSYIVFSSSKDFQKFITNQEDIPTRPTKKDQAYLRTVCPGQVHKLAGELWTSVTNWLQEQLDYSILNYEIRHTLLQYLEQVKHPHQLHCIRNQISEVLFNIMNQTFVSICSEAIIKKHLAAKFINYPILSNATKFETSRGRWSISSMFQSSFIQALETASNDKSNSFQWTSIDHILKNIETSSKPSPKQLATYDVVLVTNTFANKFNSTFTNDPAEITYKRIIIDEAHLYKKSSKNINGRLGFTMELPRALFTWYVTSTPQDMVDELFYYLSKYLGNIPNHCDAELRDCVTVKNNDDYVDRSIQLPAPNVFWLRCYEKSGNSLLRNCSMSTTIASEMINAGNVQDAVCYMGFQVLSQESILSCILLGYRESLSEIECNLEAAKQIKYPDGDQNEIERQQTIHTYDNQKISLVNQIDSIEQRLQEDVCAICMDDFHLPIVLKQCQHKYCIACIMQSIDKAPRPTCPLCRKEIFQDDVLVLSETSSALLPQSNYTRERTLDKFERLQELLRSILLQDTKRKVLIFSNHGSTFEKVEKTCDNLGILHSRLKGTSTAVQNTVSKFNNGTYPILMLDSVRYGAGIDGLQCATDIILFHSMNLNLHNQVLGRVQRMGHNDIPVNIHYLLYDSESPPPLPASSSISSVTFPLSSSSNSSSLSNYRSRSRSRSRFHSRSPSPDPSYSPLTLSSTTASRARSRSPSPERYEPCG